MGHDRKTCKLCIDDEKHLDKYDIDRRILVLEKKVKILEEIIKQRNLTIAISTQEIK